MQPECRSCGARRAQGLEKGAARCVRMQRARSLKTPIRVPPAVLGCRPDKVCGGTLQETCQIRVYRV
jgi:hypothetical protein